MLFTDATEAPTKRSAVRRACHSLDTVYTLRQQRLSDALFPVIGMHVSENKRKRAQAVLFMTTLKITRLENLCL